MTNFKKWIYAQFERDLGFSRKPMYIPITERKPIGNGDYSSSFGEELKRKKGVNEQGCQGSEHETKTRQSSNE